MNDNTLKVLAEIRSFFREEDRLPTENELQRTLKLSRDAVRQCIGELVERDILEKRSSEHFNKNWHRFKR